MTRKPHAKAPRSSRRLICGVGPVRELLRQSGRDIAVLYVNSARQARRGAGDPVTALVAEARKQGIAVEMRTRQQLDTLVDADHGHSEPRGELSGSNQRGNKPGGTNPRRARSRQALSRSSSSSSSPSPSSSSSPPSSSSPSGLRRPPHQGVVAVVGEYSYATVEDLLARPAEAPALFVALDRVQDPHNLGAIVRSAYVLGAHGLIIPQDRAASVTATVTKAAAGATEHLPIARVTNLPRALEAFKDAGLWLAALMAGPEAQPLDELDGTMPLCLVLGTEGTGIRRLVASRCDFQVVIPMLGRGVGSLNVSVAAGIALYEIARQRRQSQR